MARAVRWWGATVVRRWGEHGVQPLYDLILRPNACFERVNANTFTAILSFQKKLEDWPRAPNSNQFFSASHSPWGRTFGTLDDQALWAVRWK